MQARAPLNLDDVVTFCAAQDLPRRHWPERLVQVDHFPRTAAGKVRKQQLRDELVNATASTAAVAGLGGSGSDRGPDR